MHRLKRYVDESLASLFEMGVQALVNSLANVFSRLGLRRLRVLSGSQRIHVFQCLDNRIADRREVHFSPVSSQSQGALHESASPSDYRRCRSAGDCHQLAEVLLLVH